MPEKPKAESPSSATTGWAQADAVAGMLIAVLIVPRTLKILAEAAHILLESTPRGLNLDDVRRRAQVGAAYLRDGTWPDDWPHT